MVSVAAKGGLAKRPPPCILFSKLLSGDNRGRGRDRPNRDPYATGARLHPTICDSRPNSAPALHAGCGAILPPPHFDSRGARWPRADCDRLSRRVAGSRHLRAELEHLQIG
jgi:hypothetical protein